jgi:hypothetical protein
MGREKAIEGFHPQRDAFGIIQAIDANDHNAPGQALHDVSHERRMHRTSRKPIELRRLDTNRKNTNADHPVRRLECERIAAQHSAFLPQKAREICGVDFGLKTYEVVMTHGRNEVFMIRKCRQKFWWRERDMVKKPDFVAVTTIPKCLGQRQQVIIMNWGSNVFETRRLR